MMRFLGERVSGMIPVDAQSRAAFYRWMIFVPANLYPVFAFHDLPARWVEGQDQQVTFCDKASLQLQKVWSILEDVLQPPPYLLGGTVTALVIDVAMLGKWSAGRQRLREHRPKLIGAIDPTEQHSLVKSVWENNFAS